MHKRGLWVDIYHSLSVSSHYWLGPMSDLFTVGRGELVGEGADGVLQLQHAGVPLGQGTPQDLELLGQRPELSLGVLQLGLGSNGKKSPSYF